MEDEIPFPIIGKGFSKPICNCRNRETTESLSRRTMPLLSAHFYGLIVVFVRRGHDTPDGFWFVMEHANNLVNGFSIRRSFIFLELHKKRNVTGFKKRCVTA